MKRISLTVIALTAIVNFACAQDIAQAEVPAVIVNNFQQSYPNVKDAQWEKKNDLYEVEFEINKLETEISYDASGKVVSIERDVASGDLPANIKAAVTKAYPDSVLDDIEFINEGGKEWYEIEIDGKVLDKKVMFYTDGTEKK